MHPIEIRLRTLVLVALLLGLAATAPFLATLLPDGVAAAQSGGDPVQELVLSRPSPTPVPATTSHNSAYLRAVQVQLQKLDTASPAADVPPALSTAAVVVRVGTNPGSHLNVRSGPSLDARVLGGAPRGSLLTVQATNPDRSWLQVRWNGQDGWVFAELTRTVSGTVHELPVGDPGRQR